MDISVYLVIIIFYAFMVGVFAQLTSTFYRETCPNATSIVQGIVEEALQTDPRIAASLVRLHFHDCFVDGCDGSILLDNTDTIVSEKQPLSNNDSIRGFDVVDDIKTALENPCPGIVSCADILAIASEKSVNLSGGPSWDVPLGRRDSLTTNMTLANEAISSPFLTLDQLKANFFNQGLNSTNLIVLSGSPDPTLNTTLLEALRQICPEGGNDSFITDLDQTTQNDFDNKYFSNLLGKNGLLQTDQELFSTNRADTTTIVNTFSVIRKLSSK